MPVPGSGEMLDAVRCVNDIQVERTILELNEILASLRALLVRSSLFISLGGDRRIAVFAEVFNVFDNANFGGSYTGNGRSVLFRQPSGGFIPAIGYPRQLQLGARYLF